MATTLRLGLRTVQVDESKASTGTPPRVEVRCDSHRTVSSARGCVFHVTSAHSNSVPLFVMDNKKNKGVSPETSAAEAAKGPIKVFLIDDVSASIFSREHLSNGEMRTFYSVSFSRSYKDSDGKRVYAKTFNLEDLGKVVAVSQQADEFIRKLLQPENA